MWLLNQSNLKQVSLIHRAHFFTIQVALCYNGVMTRKDAIKRLRNFLYTGRTDIASHRQQVIKTFSCPILPNRVECHEAQYGEVACDELVPEIASTSRVILYIHGGGFVAGSKSVYREFLSLLANKSYTKVVTPEYCLAPERAFPKAIEDVQRVFHFLYAKESVALTLSQGGGEGGTKKNSAEKPIPEIVIAADGAGANIALAFLQSLQGDSRAAVKKVLLFSPWLNLSGSTILGGRRQSDEVVSTDAIVKARSLYAPNGDYKSPLLSPVYAKVDSLKNFPSVYIQVCQGEILTQDIKLMGRLFQIAGVSCMIDTFQNLPHAFFLVSDFFTETHKAVDKFARVVTGDTAMSRRQTFENTPALESSLSSEA